VWEQKDADSNEDDANDKAQTQEETREAVLPFLHQQFLEDRPPRNGVLI